MSSEIYNNSYTKSIYNLRLNSVNFYSNRGKIWYRNNVDTFSREPIDNVPTSTKAKIFSNELIRLVEKQQVTPQKIQQSVTKYLPNVDVKIISMDEYTEFGLNNKKTVAAATRPKYNAKGELQKLEIYIPNIDYNDKNSQLEFIEKLTHEITHAIQFVEDKEIQEHHKNTPEGNFYNYFQQNISNMLIDVLVQKTLVNIARDKNIEMHTIDDYNKFIESENPNVDEDEIMRLAGYKNKDDYNNYIKVGYNVFIEELMNNTQVVKDPFALGIINKCGGVEEFKEKIKEMVANTLQTEQEAYQAGNNARKTARNFQGENYNDVIPMVIGLAADALNS